MKPDPTLEPVVVDFIRRHELDTVEGAFACVEGELLTKPGLGRRSRVRLNVYDAENRCWQLYLKRYDQPGPLRRLWRFVTGRRAWCEARQEFETIRALRLAGVPTMRQVAWDAEYDLWGVLRSHLVVTAVPGEAIERCGEEFVQQHIRTPGVLEQMTDELVYVVRRFHEAGYVHRDLYASHVFLHDHEGHIQLFLIDLARAFRPRWRRFRWRVKDLAQLKYSMPWLWVELYWERFLIGYLNAEEIEHLSRWQEAIDRKVAEMARRAERRAARRKARP